MATRTASLRSGRRCNISAAPADVSSAPIDATLKTCAAELGLGLGGETFWTDTLGGKENRRLSELARRSHQHAQAAKANCQQTNSARGRVAGAFSSERPMH